MSRNVYFSMSTSLRVFALLLTLSLVDPNLLLQLNHSSESGLHQALEAEILNLSSIQGSIEEVLYQPAHFSSYEYLKAAPRARFSRQIKQKGKYEN